MNESVDNLMHIQAGAERTQMIHIIVVCFKLISHVRVCCVCRNALEYATHARVAQVSVWVHTP